MTPLSDALTAAQRRALEALGKQYVGGELVLTEVAHALENMGLTDPVERKHWLNALGIIRSTGAEAPSETNGVAQAETMMSDGQRGFIADLLRQKNVAPDDFPDTTALTQVKASELINDLKYGKYDPAKWKVPF